MSAHGGVSRSWGTTVAVGFGGDGSSTAQLRLVEPEPEAPSRAAEPPPPAESAAPRTGWGVPSLAAHLEAMSPGSPCFCCGTSFVGVEVALGSGEPDGLFVVLECPACGASLEGLPAE